MQEDAMSYITTPTTRPTICLDFDSVIHADTAGWHGETVARDGPVPGAMEFIRQAVRRFSVAVVSSRSRTQAGRQAMAEHIRMWLYDAFAIQLGTIDTDFIVNSIQYPEHTPVCFVTIDDRAITFCGTFPDVNTLVGFKPWNNSEHVKG